MSELSEKIVSAAKSNPDGILWNDLSAQLTEREKSNLMNTVRDLRKRGEVWRKVTVATNGDVTVRIVSGKHPNMK